MDASEDQAVMPAAGTDLRAPLESLRHLVNTLLVLMIVLSGTLWIFLRWQVRYTSRELEFYRPQATNMIAQFQRGPGPVGDEFVRQLSEYARSHPDFAPILAKYGVKPAVPAASTTPGAATSSPSKK